MADNFFRILFQPRAALLIALGTALILLASITALTASNIVPVSGLSDRSYPIDPNDLKPPECSHIHIENLVNLAAGDRPTNGNDLILGTDGSDWNINGRAGDDCLVGGDGDDRLRGGRGNDVLLGQNGDDDLYGGQGYDICYGGPGNNTFARCEEEYP